MRGVLGTVGFCKIMMIKRSKLCHMYNSSYPFTECTTENLAYKYRSLGIYVESGQRCSRVSCDDFCSQEMELTEFISGLPEEIKKKFVYTIIKKGIRKEKRE